MPQDVSIHPMGKGDCARVADMITALMAFHGDSGGATEASVAEYCTGPKRLGQILVAHVNGRISGFALIYDWPNLLRGKRIRHLELMFVKPDQRRSGLGRRIMAHIARHAIADNCAGVTLSAATTNGGANAFYASLGFIERPMNANSYAISGSALRNLAADRQ